MAIDAQVTLVFTANDRRQIGLSAALGVNIPVNLTLTQAYVDGVGAAQANALYQGQLALSSGINNIDLSGVLTDSYGTLLTPLRLKALAIQNNSASNNMIVGAGTNPFIGLFNAAGTVTLAPGDWFSWASGSATGAVITASTGDILKVAGTGTDLFTLVFLAGKT